MEILEPTVQRENQVLLEMPSKESRENKENKETRESREPWGPKDKMVPPSRENLVPLDCPESLA